MGNYQHYDMRKIPRGYPYDAAVRRKNLTKGYNYLVDPEKYDYDNHLSIIMDEAYAEDARRTTLKAEQSGEEVTLEAAIGEAALSPLRQRLAEAKQRRLEQSERINDAGRAIIEQAVMERPSAA